MNIAVLAGGLSPERDVSLVSGSLIANSLMKSGHKVCLVDLYEGREDLGNSISELFIGKESGVTFEHKIQSLEPDLEKLIEKNGNRKDPVGPNVINIARAADVTFLALHGGIGENGQLQAMLDLYGIKYTGSSYKASAVAMDKALTKKIITCDGIDNAKWILFDISKDDSSRIIKEIGLPCVIKPCGCGSSVGVSIVETEDELEAALTYAAKYENNILIEEKITGREFSVGVLDGKVLPPIEIIALSGFYDYKNKYQSGCTKEVCPPDITEEETDVLQSSALKVFNSLGLKDYSRIDFILTRDKRAYCLEANTLPGMTPNSLLPQEAAAVGISYDELCLKIAVLAYNTQK